jgi:hypothetical protein
LIDTREQLIHVLTEAAEVEHDLLCSYLYAAFSLKRSGDPGLTASQLEAVERWRKTILKVALEEMAHLAVVNNLLIAVGGAPHFDRPNLPVAPGYHPAGMVVRLTPFDRATLEHFIFLERPENEPIGDAPGFDPLDLERKPRRGGLTPSAQDYATVGELYDSVADGLKGLALRHGESALLDREGAGQLDSEITRLANVPRITSLKSALAAVAWIKEEGEGSSGASQDSHFQRFRSIQKEWAALSNEDPAFEPAWPAAADPVMRRPATDASRVWVTAEPAATYLDLGNALYGLMLQALTQTFTSSDPIEQQRLMAVAVELMEASAAIATALVRMPASADHPGVNAGLTFAVPRNLGFRRTRSSSADLFIERLRELRAAAVQHLEGAALEKAERRLANASDLLSS